MKRPTIIRGTQEDMPNAVAHESDPVEQVPTHQMRDPRFGPLIVTHADGIDIGTIRVGKVERICLRVIQQGCDCGCNRPGNALLITPDPAFARELSAALIRFAEKFEGEAASQAEAAIVAARKSK